MTKEELKEVYQAIKKLKIKFHQFEGIEKEKIVKKSFSKGGVFTSSCISLVMESGVTEHIFGKSLEYAKASDEKIIYKNKHDDTIHTLSID